MFVFCDNCKNHYDDSTQKKVCKGIGSMHPSNGESQPVDEHARNTREANRLHANHRPVGPHHARSEPSRTDAPTSGDQSPA